VTTGQRSHPTAQDHAAHPARGIHETAPGVYTVTAEAPSRGHLARARYHLRRFVLGPAIASSRERTQRLQSITGLAILGADAIASSVYGPEEMLRMLSAGGVPAITTYALPISLLIVVLLSILALSYWQTIEAYPGGAGGYIVASANLGRRAGLVSAAALLVDYNLDVAVSVASGVQTISSTLALLAPWKVLIALIALAAITLANLRGIRTAGVLMSIPIYVYILGSAGVIAIGIFHWATGTLPPYTPPETTQAILRGPFEAVGILLLLRAFSSGAVALTGVEAISNGVPYFRPPETRNAHRTLFLLAVIFGLLMLGIGFLSGALGVVPDPTETETVHSQLTRTLIGGGPAYLVLEASALLLLVLAADTGFADFPRLLSLLARDGIVPHAFTVRGSRLAFTNGIVLVAIVSGVLIVLFRGSVTALVPLFTVGAFATFTLSQVGMARHWWKQRGVGWHWRMVVNGLGAAVTTIVLCVVVISKFAYGAWIVLVLMPLIVLVLHTLAVHHDRLQRQLRVSSAQGPGRVLSPPLRHHAIITVERIDRSVLLAVNYAQAFQATVEAVFVTDDHSRGAELHKQWGEMNIDIPLVVLESPYRWTTTALARYLDFLQKKTEPRCFVTVILPEVQPTRWWHPLIHNYFAWRLKWDFLFRRDTAVTSVPYATHH
jgi:amino acid transporter